MSRNKPRIGFQFAPRRIDMLESPAHRELRLSARLVIDRIEIELAHHGGNDNGRLPVTYDDFEQYGLHRHAIAAAIREAVALGFIEVTEHGRAGNSEWRKPNYFRLTYRHTKGVDKEDGTHEWKLIAAAPEARTIAVEARKKRSSKIQNSSGGKRHSPVAVATTKNTDSIVRQPPLQAVVRQPPLLSISGSGGRDDLAGGASHVSPLPLEADKWRSK